MGPHSLLLAATALLSVKLSHQYNCDTSTICLNTSPGKKVQDPFNCHNYYICVDNTTASDVLTCPDGEYFDDSLGSDKCKTETSPCLTHCSHHCPTHCGEDGSILADPFDCSKYHVCSDGNPTFEETCNPEVGEYFDGTHCQKNPALCCDVCTPFCEENEKWTQVEDPKDCRAYYICEENNSIPADHGFCPQDQFFDYEKKKCRLPHFSESKDCTAVCNAG